MEQGAITEVQFLNLSNFSPTGETEDNPSTVSSIAGWSVVW